MHQAPAELPGRQWRKQLDSLGLAWPIEITVSRQTIRQASASIHANQFGGVLPPGSVFAIDEEKCVASPELCLVQMANSLPLAKLIELGLELCGSYSIPDRDLTESSLFSDNKTVYGLPPITNVGRITSFIEQASGISGLRLARRALDYLQNGSASPMETVLTLLLTLPYRLGGYGLPQPRLNARVKPSPITRGYKEGKAYYALDLYWHEARIAVEYDSDLHHTGADRINEDSMRRTDLALMGINVITVTRQQVYGIADFDRVANLLASHLRTNLRHDRNPTFTDSRRKLRESLL